MPVIKPLIYRWIDDWLYKWNLSVFNSRFISFIYYLSSYRITYMPLIFVFLYRYLKINTISNEQLGLHKKVEEQNSVLKRIVDRILFPKEKTKLEEENEIKNKKQFRKKQKT